MKHFLWPVEARARRLSNMFRAHSRGEMPPPLAFDVEDAESLGDRADKIFAGVQNALPFGSVERSRMILDIIAEGFPTPILEEAYFSNLTAMLERTNTLSTQGQLVIGLGTGRSGSTSLASRLGAVPNSCSTHENPPLVFWCPAPRQVAFHIRRFALMTRYFALVADCAHWWINVIDGLVSEFPNVKFVGTVRDRYECAVSFARIKGLGPGTLNHWAPPNRLWRSTVWDPTYPNFEIAPWAERDPDRAKWEMIHKYLDLYSSMMASAAARLPDKFLILGTESLSDPLSMEQLYRFIGLSPVSRAELVKLNVRSTKDGRLESFRK